MLPWDAETAPGFSPTSTHTYATSSGSSFSLQISSDSSPTSYKPSAASSLATYAGEGGSYEIDYAIIPSDCPQTTPGASTTCYRYDSDFPSKDKWLAWKCLAPLNRAAMVKDNNGNRNGPDEADYVVNAVYQTSIIAGIDPRVALAVVMQETVGLVRPMVGDNGKSYGLFQDQLTAGDGPPATCNGTSVKGCSEAEIFAMAGIFGHADTEPGPVYPGLGYWVPQVGGDIAKAVRGYNTGSIPDPHDLTNVVLTDVTTGQKYFGGTQTYVSDIGNRLIGAVVGAPHPLTCNNLDRDPQTVTGQDW